MQTLEVSIETRCHEYLTKYNWSMVKDGKRSLIENETESLSRDDKSEVPVAFEAKECDLDAIPPPPVEDFDSDI